MQRLALVLATVLAVVIVLGAIFGSAARADDDPLHVRIDVEPAAYVLRGYSAHVKLSPPAIPRLVVGVGAYGFDVPRLMVDLGAGNKDEAWDARLVVGGGVSVDGFFGHHRDHGWIAGGQIGAQRYRVRLDGDEASYTTLLLLGRVGYEWHPWGRNFYFFPWLAAAFTPQIGGETRAGGDDYDTISVVPYGAVELGWQLR
jgi:hypothetical protein